MRNLLAVLFPAATLALFGGGAAPPSTASRSADAVERNKAVVRELTEVVWNRRGLDRVADFYAPDFVAGYRPAAAELTKCQFWLYHGQNAVRGCPGP
jgi:hypothetical protein